MTRIALPLNEDDIQAILAEPDSVELIEDLGLWAVLVILRQGAVTALTLGGMEDAALARCGESSTSFFAPLNNQSSSYH